jgi:hypothetical protein
VTDRDDEPGGVAAVSIFGSAEGHTDAYMPTLGMSPV